MRAATILFGSREEMTTIVYTPRRSAMAFRTASSRFAGWPGGAAWLNSGTWLNRLNFMNRLITNRKDADTAAVDFSARMQSQALDTPEKVLDGLLDLLVDGNVGGQARNVLLDYAQRGRSPQASGPAWNDQRWVDERARGLAYLIMAMPEYHLN